MATIDTKYRETVPNLVKNLPFGMFSDDEHASMVPASGKNVRKSKRIKVGKNGLHAGEDVDIARWWMGRDISSVACDSEDARDSVTRTAILEQRVRETQLQVVLVLETLALEASAPDAPHASMSEIELSATGTHSQKPKKSRKPLNLETHLDLLADRLCIWHSMDINEAKTSDGDDRQPSDRRPKAPEPGDDSLRQFCVDVILPL